MGQSRTKGGPKEGQKKAPWRDRKEAYISKLKHKSHETLLVSCADKLHNARSIMFDHDRISDEIWERFSPTKEETLWYYEGLCQAFADAWSENPLLPDFKAMVGRMRRAAGIEE